MKPGSRRLRRLWRRAPRCRCSYCLSARAHDPTSPRTRRERAALDYERRANGE